MHFPPVQYTHTEFLFVMYHWFGSLFFLFSVYAVLFFVYTDNTSWFGRTERFNHWRPYVQSCRFRVRTWRCYIESLWAQERRQITDQASSRLYYMEMCLCANAYNFVSVCVNVDFSSIFLEDSVRNINAWPAFQIPSANLVLRLSFPSLLNPFP